MKEAKIKKDNAFAENLKRILDDNGITMTQLANDTGITYNMVKKYCHGMAEPTISYALKIAETLNVSMDWLMGYEPAEKKDMFREVFEQDVTYIAGFMRTVRKLPDKIAMVDPIEEKEWTYARLNEDVNMLANALLDSGVRKKDLVFYQLPNSTEFVFSYLAPQKIGAVTSPANPNFSPGETVVCLENNRPKIYIYDESVRDMAVTALELSSHRPDIVLMAGSGELPEGHLRLSEFMAGGSAGEPETDFVPNVYEEVMRLYTSGTTGKPKGVPVTNANEVMTCHDVIMHFPMNSTDTTMNMTPWFHRGGIHSGGPAPTFYAGGRIIILRNFQPQISLKYTEKYGITFLVGVPSVIKMLVRIQERFKADLSSLRGIVTMGAPFERADCIRVQEVLTPNIFNGYGTTESFWNTFLRPYDLPEMSGTAGRSCTDDEVRIVRVGGEPDDLVAMDSVDAGEIIIRTPKSSYRYYDNPEEEKKKFYKGWVYTGSPTAANARSV